MNLLFSLRSLEPLLVLYLPVVAVNYHTFLCDYKIQTSFSDQEEIAVGCLGGNFGQCLPPAWSSCTRCCYHSKYLIFFMLFQELIGKAQWLLVHFLQHDVYIFLIFSIFFLAVWFCLLLPARVWSECCRHSLHVCVEIYMLPCLHCIMWSLINTIILWPDFSLSHTVVTTVIKKKKKKIQDVAKSCIFNLIF